ncbi:hypothetical protein LIER_15738 [Lithospermum erythrorhizon]|uniref:Integrase zinc-binding domain-containing protein n=1 Tax=Lithospermum erythrorhizon TaxID=34254 RepID=A0AAV3Q9A7_LITER
MIQGELYKSSHLGPLLSCVAKRNIDQVLYEVHEGEVCGHHMGGQSLALKITRDGYFWPTLMNDAAEYVKRCDSCQKMQVVPCTLVTEMTPVLCPVPFALWKIDMVEVMNRTIFMGIKKNLLESGAKWQIGFEEDQNNTRIRELLDFGDEGRDRVILKMQKYKKEMAKFYNRRVKNRQFVAGDLVLRMFKASRAKDVNKLNPKWEGPYRVRRVVGPGTYILEELS